MAETTTHEKESVVELNLTTVNNLPAEIEVVDDIRLLREQYKVPILTPDISIEDGAIPHSHPILTLNARKRTPELLLEVFSHEQMHWFFDLEAEKRDAFVEFAKSQYQDLGDCNTQVNPISFWEHLCVIWNTVAILRSQVEEQQVRWVFGGPHRSYPLTHALVFNEYDRLGSDLQNHGMIYDLAELK